MTTVSVRLDKELLKDLSKIEKNWHSDRSESIRRLLSDAIASWKLKQVLEALKEHKVSIGKAAKECNMPLWDMMDVAKKAGIDWMGYSKEELERDLKLSK